MKLKWRRFYISVIVIIIFALAWNTLVHAVLLKDANQALFEIARSAEDRNIAVGLALTLGIAIVFVWTYWQTVKHGTLKEGLLHGAVFAVLAGLLVDLNQYLIYPIPGSLAVKWFIFGSLEFLFYGIIVSSIYRRKVAA